mmetsp:Transcript_41500/g.98364  ORF Transcript_41500/g.98364 Transcript_41500/m.98364 type:complete len:220 (-) Transcript_41500:87-746(-)
MDSAVEKQLAAVLRTLGARNKMMYTHYKTSKEHKERMAALPDHLRIPRCDWEKHPNWRTRWHMPAYHVHFREDMGSVITGLQRAHAAASKAGSEGGAGKLVMDACRAFGGCMRHLQGHVGIEEGSYFPSIQREYKGVVELGFLYEDHGALHKGEERVQREMNRLIPLTSMDPTAGGALSKGDIEGLLAMVLEFDEQLMTHLGEEEEIIVPMTLMAKRSL